MKTRTPFVVAFAIAVLAIGVSVVAQTGAAADEDALRKYLEQVGVSELMLSPADSEHWRQLSPDLGLLLREDAEGALRATVYAFNDGRWVPVAVDGFSEIGPQYMFLQR